MTSAVSEILKVKMTLRFNQLLLNKSFHVWNKCYATMKTPEFKIVIFGLQLGLVLESNLFSSTVNFITIQTWGGELSTHQLSPKEHLNS